MSIRYWVRLFFATLVIGGCASLLIGIIIEWDIYAETLAQGHLIDFIKSILLLFGTGFMFSALSQMGFFAYLTVHRIFLGMFGSVSLWNKVQVLLVAFVFFDLVYFRYIAFSAPNKSVLNDILLPSILLFISIGIALWKKAETNRYAFIPTLFFMFVVTTIEWLPVLKENNLRWVIIMGTTLAACNAYQVLKLHRILQNSRARPNQSVRHREQKQG